jgi:hypothetical protein
MLSSPTPPVLLQVDGQQVMIQRERAHYQSGNMGNKGDENTEENGGEERSASNPGSPLADLRSTVKRQVRHPYITNQGLTPRDPPPDRASCRQTPNEAGSDQ